jgi:hypothetical protein
VQMGMFDIISATDGLPLVAFHLKDDPDRRVRQSERWCDRITDESVWTGFCGAGCGFPVRTLGERGRERVSLGDRETTDDSVGGILCARAAGGVSTQTLCAHSSSFVRAPDCELRVTDWNCQSHCVGLQQ